MKNTNRLTELELQEKALYDMVQYLPLPELNLQNGNSIKEIVKLAEKRMGLLDFVQDAISANLPTIRAILKDRPELGEAKISNMSWKDNNHDGKPDHPVVGIQACTFERENQVYIVFRGTPKRAWLDNGKALTPDNVEAARRFYQLMAKDIRKSWGVVAAMDYKMKKKLKNYKDKKKLKAMGNLNGIFPPEIYNYTSSMQEEAIWYIEGLKNSPDGSKSIFGIYDKVYVTGHSKGGNEATLATIIYPDLIDICISGSGQGFSPEFVEFIKKILGDEGLAKIQDKIFGFNAKDDYINPIGITVIKEENRIYFDPGIDIKTPIDLLYNHFPQKMINPKTGKIARITEQGKFGKFIGVVSEKLMKMNIKDRADAAIVAMAPFQYIFGGGKPIYIDGDELGIDTLDIKESFFNGIKVLKKVLVESLMEKEGKALIIWLTEEFGYKYPYPKKSYESYSSLDMEYEIKELEQFIQEVLNDLLKEKESKKAIFI